VGLSAWGAVCGWQGNVCVCGGGGGERDDCVAAHLAADRMARRVVSSARRRGRAACGASISWRPSSTPRASRGQGVMAAERAGMSWRPLCSLRRSLSRRAQCMGVLRSLSRRAQCMGVLRSLPFGVGGRAKACRHRHLGVAGGRAEGDWMRRGRLIAMNYITVHGRARDRGNERALERPVWAWVGARHGT
jgi:hypothetical protein